MSEPPMGETWKPETSLRWRMELVPSSPDTRLVRTLEQIWICVETGRTEWRLVPEVWPEQSSNSVQSIHRGDSDADN